ncbi:Small subunit (SSU) processome component [Acarospora aff. strigata]|nr:Small subunit (SSU) processome component [Acarospora aff. strigata]
MVSKKSSRGPQSQISSATSLATASNTQAANKSSIFRSSFSPSHYQLALFADVIQGFDSQHLRIHNTLTGRLRCDHAIGSKATINSLDWGYYGGKHGPYNQQQSKKKRKRNHEVNGDAGGDAGGDVVVAFGTSDSDIQMFSPTEDRIIAKLQGAHTQGIRDFKFTNRDDSAEGWSLGGDGKLTQWDLRTGTSKRQVRRDYG